MPLKLAFALFIALMFSTSKLRAINFFRTAYYLPSILGGSIAIAVLWRYIFADTGLVNMAIGLFGAEPINWLAIRPTRSSPSPCSGSGSSARRW